MNSTGKQKLDRLQELTDRSQPDLLDRAMELLEREIVLNQIRDDFIAISEDDKSVEAYDRMCDGYPGAPAGWVRKRKGKKE
jgi:hypothetical protein